MYMPPQAGVFPTLCGVFHSRTDSCSLAGTRGAEQDPGPDGWVRYPEHGGRAPKCCLVQVEMASICVLTDGSFQEISENNISKNGCFFPLIFPGKGCS